MCKCVCVCVAIRRFYLITLQLYLANHTFNISFTNNTCAWVGFMTWAFLRSLKGAKLYLLIYEILPLKWTSAPITLPVSLYLIWFDSVINDNCVWDCVANTEYRQTIIPKTQHSTLRTLWRHAHNAGFFSRIALLFFFTFPLLQNSNQQDISSL